METTIQLSCPVCDKTFLKRLATVKQKRKQNPDWKFYCSSLCSSASKRKPLQTRICVGCSEEFTRKPTGVKDKLLYCTRGCGARHAVKPKDHSCKWCANSIKPPRKVCDECRSGKTIENQTLQFIRDNYSTTSFHGRVRCHSRKVYLLANPNATCHFCDYDLYLEIAHIKPVASFDSNEKLAVVNDIENLVAMCRNHHWEYDHGHIALDGSI